MYIPFQHQSKINCFNLKINLVNSLKAEREGSTPFPKPIPGSELGAFRTTPNSQIKFS